MKNLISLLFFISISGIIAGTYVANDDEVLGNKIIGFSVVFLVFVFHAYFSLQQMEGKKLSDYTLSEENLKKMKAKSSKIN